MAALLGSGNGNLKLLMNDGLVSRNLMEILGLNVGNSSSANLVTTKCALTARRQIWIGSTAWRVRKSSPSTRKTRLSTSPAPPAWRPAAGFNHRSGKKGIRIITLRSPLYVRGTFKIPAGRREGRPLIARGAVAAALATLVTPAAALLALISPSEGEAMSVARFYRR
ncbi:hypothetical protein ACNKHO_22245 [Shigella flexneri]